MSRYRKLSRTSEGVRRCRRYLAVAVAALVSAGTASAQVAPWSLNGSDTLEQMVRQAITNATADGTLASVGQRCQTPNSIVTKGHCSVSGAACSTTSGGVACPTGQTCTADASQACTSTPDECSGFHALARCRATSELYYAGGGSTTGETNLRNNLQSLAPMSRNFRDNVIFTDASETTRRSFCKVNPTVECTTSAALCTGVNDACQPRLWNVTGKRNVVALDAGVIVTKQGGVKNFQLPIVGTDETIAAPNADPGNFSFLSYSTGYTNLLTIILGGVDGSGSFAACSDPRRLNAVQDLAFLQGTPSGTIKHFYRRDDNSGTTDTFKEKLRVDRFCNGRAVGVNGTNKSNPNMNNQDYDPIRRPCEILPGQRQSTCWDVTVTPPVACSPADANPNCTQGLVVALSVGDNDTTLADVTTTIGSRVDADPDSVGFAGREAVQSASFLTSGPNIRTRSPDNDSVRIGLYMLSRRLFVQYADQDGDAGTTVTNATLATSGGASRVAAEAKLWDWISDPATDGRCRFDPIVRQFGFITCLNDCSADPDLEAGNLCGGVAPLFKGAPSACVPGAGGGGPTFWPVNGGGGSCTSGQICCSTGAVCPASGQCPAVALLQRNAPCAKNGDCASGVCADTQAIGTTICQ